MAFEQHRRLRRPVGRRAVRRGRKENGRRQFLDRWKAAGRAADERAEVIGEVGKACDRQRRRRRGEGLRHPLEHHELRAGVALHQKRPLGGICRPPAGRARIGQEDVLELALRADRADVEGDPAGGVQERPFGEESRRDVLGDLAPPLGELRSARRHEHMGEDRHHEGDHEAEVDDGARQPEGREARGHHHHEFAFRREPVGDIDRGHEGRHRQDETDHVRKGERGEFQEHPGRLPVGDELVEERDRAVDPVDGHQDEREEAEEHHQLRQHVSVEFRHCFLVGLPRPIPRPKLGAGKLISGQGRRARIGSGPNSAGV